MTLLTRLWTTGYADNLFTTVPAAIRKQLRLTPDHKIVWTIQGGVAEIRAHTPDDHEIGEKGHTLYKQTRGNSLYTAIPMHVSEQLRLTTRSRAEWELHDTTAHLRRA